MSGNVWEWTHDTYTASLGTGDTTDPVREIDSYRVVRGGSWSHNPHDLRSARRYDNAPGSRFHHFGFRVGRTDNAGTPSAPEVSISPAAPTEAVDDIICTIDTESVDPDGNSVTYTFAWTVDGVDYTGTPNTTTETGDTIDASETAAGEVWECSVTPNDGTEDGYTGTASVIVTSACALTDCDSSLDLGAGIGIDFVEISGSDLVDPSAITLSNDFFVMTTECPRNVQSVMAMIPTLIPRLMVLVPSRLLCVLAYGRNFTTYRLCKYPKWNELSLVIAVAVLVAPV